MSLPAPDRSAVETAGAADGPSRAGADYGGLHLAHAREAADRQVWADRIAAILWDHMRPGSVIDVGCGLGFLLRSCQNRGAAVQGVEGPWIADQDVAVNRAEIAIADLNTGYASPARYDLCACLEVAEHLDPERGPGLVQDLCALSDVVLFSAAIPGQSGTGHVNCRWQSYWAKQFATQGYDCFDLLRPTLAADPSTPFWFAQNLLLFARRGTTLPDSLAPFRIEPDAADMVRPDLYAIIAEAALAAPCEVQRRAEIAPALFDHLGRT